MPCRLWFRIQHLCWKLNSILIDIISDINFSHKALRQSARRRPQERLPKFPLRPEAMVRTDNMDERRVCSLNALKTSFTIGEFEIEILPTFKLTTRIKQNLFSNNWLCKFTVVQYVIWIEHQCKPGSRGGVQNHNTVISTNISVVSVSRFSVFLCRNFWKSTCRVYWDVVSLGITKKR